MFKIFCWFLTFLPFFKNFAHFWSFLVYFSRHLKTCSNFWKHFPDLILISLQNWQFFNKIVFFILFLLIFLFFIFSVELAFLITLILRFVNETYVKNGCVDQFQRKTSISENIILIKNIFLFTKISIFAKSLIFD